MIAGTTARKRCQGSESGCEVQPACGPRELRVDPADTGTHQAVSLDEREDLVVGRGDNRGEFAEEPQHFRPLGEVAARRIGGALDSPGNRVARPKVPDPVS